MKKILFIVYLTVYSVCGFSQNFQRQAKYKVISKVNLDFLNNRKMPEHRKEMIKKRLKSASNKTFILTFNPKESIYKEEVILEDNMAPSKRGGRRMMMFASMMGMTLGENLYKNLIEKRCSYNQDIFGKPFLIKDQLKEYKWQMSDESKKIGNYTVYKATTIIKSKVMPNFFSRKKTNEEQKITYVDKIITAWYCLDIPINNGPYTYWGLPGLILEVTDGTTTMLCSEIKINPAKRIKIKESKKGKKISKTEFDKLLKEKSKEMRERRGGGFRRHRRR